MPLASRDRRERMRTQTGLLAQTHDAQHVGNARVR
jgi:hypothetical protein